jgi:ABC-type nitrate/sulfonate/bicarbonate transport system substrate-binding protein
MPGTDRQTKFAPTELWYTRCPVPTASGIAQHYRWLHQEFAAIGIELRSIRAADDRGVRDSHFNHSHPGMFREGGNIPAIWARANGQNTAVVGITWVDEEQVILARPDSAIRDVGDLRGRRVGLPKHESPNVDFSRAMALRGFVTALGLAGLRSDDARFVDIPSGDIDLREDPATGHSRRNAVVEALLAGEIDALYVKGAQGDALLKRHGLRVVLDINSHPDPVIRINNGTPRPITVDRNLAIQNEELVARYLAVLLRTAEWAKTHRGEVIEAVAAETNTTPQDVADAYGPNFHQKFRAKLAADYLAALENQKNFLRDWGFLAADFDFPSWIVLGPLARAEGLLEEELWPLGSDAAE